MNVNVHVFICDVIVYIACHLPLTLLLGIIVQFNKFYSILYTAELQWLEHLWAMKISSRQG